MDDGGKVFLVCPFEFSYFCIENLDLWGYFSKGFFVECTIKTSGVNKMLVVYTTL